MDVTSECEQHWMGQHSFVCLYGYRMGGQKEETKETRVMTYDLDQLRNLSNPTLEAEVKNFCQNQFDYIYKSKSQHKPDCIESYPMTGWSHITNKSLDDLTLTQYFVCHAIDREDLLIRLEFPLKQTDKIRLNYTDYENSGVSVFLSSHKQYEGDWWRRTFLIVPITFNKPSTGGGDLVIYNCGGKLWREGEYSYLCTTQTPLGLEDSRWWQLPPHPVVSISITTYELPIMCLNSNAFNDIIFDFYIKFLII